jgi:zona occludens toxin (predicted ATPase)
MHIAVAYRSRHCIKEYAMRHQRHIEVNVLGYRIERIRQIDAEGEVTMQWYEVLAPESEQVLGRFAQRAEAEREIVTRELAALPRAAA